MIPRKAASSEMTITPVGRVLGCLKGLAVGDAIGKQSETLSRDDVLHWYPNGIHDFEGVPGSVIPRYVGNSKRQWRIGETTDDTERTLAVARAIITERKVSHLSIGRELLQCTKCVHPGLKSLWEFHQAGDPNRIATTHDGCGAAIRVAPVGIFYASGRLDEIVEGAYEASISTHGGSLAIAAAAATAAAVSAAIDAASAREILELATRAADQAQQRWPARERPAFANALRAAHDLLSRFAFPLRPEMVAACCFPNQPLTIVPLALALAAVLHSADEAVLLAANVGGDSDSVASIAGGVLGAMYPSTVGDRWYAIVKTVNRHDLVRLASELARLRH